MPIKQVKYLLTCFIFKPNIGTPKEPKQKISVTLFKIQIAIANFKEKNGQKLFISYSCLNSITFDLQYILHNYFNVKDHMKGLPAND